MTRTQPTTNRGMSHLTSFLTPIAIVIVIITIGTIFIGAAAVNQPTNTSPSDTHEFSYDYIQTTNQLMVTYENGPSITAPEYVTTSTDRELALHEPGDTITGTVKPGETIELAVMNKETGTGVIVDTYTAPETNTTTNQ